MTSNGGAEKLRIYCETLPYEELVQPHTIRLLRRHPIEIVLAVRPWQMSELSPVTSALRDAGIAVSVWPMLSDDEGRWASAKNARSFVRLVRSVVDVLEAGAARPHEMLLDLEPPFAHARALAVRGGSRASTADDVRAAPSLRDGTMGGATTGDVLGAASELAREVAELHARGIATASAVWPLVALDPIGQCGWQGLLGTPVDAIATTRVSVMVYTSILEGWSRGTIRRHDATALLAAASARAVGRWREAAGVSIGCVGPGALVDEPTYRDPSELAEDAALVRAAGCRDISLFDLGGVLARPPAESWLDAFAETASFLPARGSRRVHLARRLARIATWALGRRRARDR